MKFNLKIIVEIGVNFNGSFKILKKMIKLISKTKVDFVKFQLFKTNYMCTRKAPLAMYQKKQKQNQYNMLKKYEISDDLLFKIITYCKRHKIKPLFSVFDIPSFHNLLKYKPVYLKIPSGEITNFPLLEAISKKKIKIIISTGMSTNQEIKEALKILLKGKIKKTDICILHCHSDYPSRLRDLNLSRIPMLKEKFKCKVGFSDHSIGFLASIVGVSLGAEVIEKHVTLDRKMIGPDHKASLEIKHLKEFVSQIKSVQIIKGKNTNKRSKIEEKNKKVVRKSIVALKSIKKGEKFNIENISCKRPGTGISAKYFKNLLNKKASKNFRVNQMITI